MPTRADESRGDAKSDLVRRPPGHLWGVVDRLRRTVDEADFKELVLGLVLLRHLSTLGEEDVRGRDVPNQRPWDVLRETPRDRLWPALRTLATALAPPGTGLGRTLPKVFDRVIVDSDTLAELVAAVGLPEAAPQGAQGGERVRLDDLYERLLDAFARAEGPRGGEYTTPHSVARLVVEMLEPYEGRVYDPCLGVGGFHVEAAKFAARHADAQEGERQGLRCYGQESDESAWRLAGMNLAVHGVDPKDLGHRWGDTLASDRWPQLKADFVMANPPFNMPDWSRDATDPRWRYGLPPTTNANYAWLQHVVDKLDVRGTGAVVLTKRSMSTQQTDEAAIRAALVEADLVACVVALPYRLFPVTLLPACIWILTKDKSAQGTRASTDRRGQTLFIDARGMGVIAGRAERILTADNITEIAGAYRAWRGTSAAVRAGNAYQDDPRLCRSVRTAELRDNAYVLLPGKYVRPTAAAQAEASAATSTQHQAQAETREWTDDEIARMNRRLLDLIDRSEELSAALRPYLYREDPWDSADHES